MQMAKIGLSITNFTISSFTYPQEVQQMQTRAASQSMIGDLNRYQQMAMTDAMAQGGSGSRLGADMANMQMGMMMGQQMMAQMQNMSGNPQMQAQPAPQNHGGTMQQTAGPRFCPNCGTPTTGSRFCPQCGNQLLP